MQGGARGPALLVTFDRHLDLLAPTAKALPPVDDLRRVDDFARWELDLRNVDHVLAAMELGLLSDAVVVARARPRGVEAPPRWTDRHGRAHRLWVHPTLEAAWADEDVRAALQADGPALLDVDLDCFTSPSDADPSEVVPWTEPLIRRFLRPPDAYGFWSTLLPRVEAVTLAREPLHCGGLVEANRLFEAAARVLFQEVLEVDLP